jgi:hypothetical protein
MTGSAIRGSDATPPVFYDSRCDLMWTPPAPGITLTAEQQTLPRTCGRASATPPAGPPEQRHPHL